LSLAVLLKFFTTQTVFYMVCSVLHEQMKKALRGDANTARWL